MSGISEEGEGGGDGMPLVFGFGDGMTFTDEDDLVGFETGRMTSGDFSTRRIVASA